MKVILLANWGIGLEVLKVLNYLPEIDIQLVVTRFQNPSYDKWDNIVHDFAMKKGYQVTRENVLSFQSLKDKILQEGTDLLISHAFMKIIPQSVFSAPRLGSINIHPSLLPKYRGPSPSHWVIQNREIETGLTCHYIDKGIDTGDIIYQVAVVVKPKSTIDSIIESQKKIVAKLISESLIRITDSNFCPVPQNSQYASFAPRPRKGYYNEKI